MEKLRKRIPSFTAISNIFTEVYNLCSFYLILNLSEHFNADFSEFFLF